MHRYSLPTLGLAACLAVAPVVVADEHPQSIMFEQREDLSHLTTRPAPSPEQSDRCAELAREVEALKGRPQRRFTAAQRYEAECKR